MLSLGDLKAGTFFVMDDDPWQVLEARFVKMAQRTGHLEAKVRNLKTGILLTRSFKQADRFEEADLELMRAIFIYGHRDKYVFSYAADSKERFELTPQKLGDATSYLVPGLQVDALRFDGEIISINLPPKVDMKIVEATPWVKGDTATGGAKTVVTETGLRVRTPHFIEMKNVIRVNTKTGEYVERVE